MNLKKNNKFINVIEDITKKNLGINLRKLFVMNIEIYIVYISQIIDKDKLSNSIIKPILKYDKDDNINIDKIAHSIIYVEDISIDNDENNILSSILEGKSVIISNNDDNYLIANTTKVEKREISLPEIENTLRGPKDAFTENFDANLSLIRYRIRDENLKIDNFKIGKRTKTNIGVIYIDDIANKNYVSEIKNRLQKINIDGIVESGYIEKFILNNALDIFPQVGLIERSDMAATAILEGKVCIIVEGSNIALSTPKTFMEFLGSGDDRYDNTYISVFSKVLRIVSFNIALTLSSIYVAIISFHTDVLPEQYILALAMARETVPFNAVSETLIMEGISEILKEANIRLPKQIGSAIGIVGTIVIGQAAVSAGLVSPLMVIIVSLSTMCSFVAPDYTIMNPIRVLKFFMIIITSIFGLFGFVMGYTLIIINLISTTSFGIPYLAPIAPFNFSDFKNYILDNITLAKERPRFLRTKDKTRQ
ncbi:spore germination protein [Tepidibacter formicigenes]|jgi:hypothetical protein|uniref:Spore germination protein KA n=1 Tax=Tepidibacter formicigenes DSM 15518 TaxID=1123349 RepID=A0A1M6MBG6_9FIRM|nr:spore germination protein [Tepidibacter formicigenes]SHJ80700.1 spore germination protein KA [Tepidibacter formicigenes DSM 15518]